MTTPAKPISVLCVDDNDLVAEGLRRRFEQDPSLRWLGWVSDGDAVLSTVREARPDIVLMDIDLPGVDTFGLVEELAAQMPEVRSLMFSGHVRLSFIERALDCGAWGYLSKNEDTSTLMDCIKQAAGGAIVLSREVQAVQRSGLH